MPSKQLNLLHFSAESKNVCQAQKVAPPRRPRRHRKFKKPHPSPHNTDTFLHSQSKKTPPPPSCEKQRHPTPSLLTNGCGMGGGCVCQNTYADWYHRLHYRVTTAAAVTTSSLSHSHCQIQSTSRIVHTVLVSALQSDPRRINLLRATKSPASAAPYNVFEDYIQSSPT